MIRLLLSLLTALSIALPAMAVQSSVDHPQGILWRLRESGRLVEAEQFEKELVKILTTAPVSQVSRFNSHTSPSYIVHFGNNLVAFMKESERAIPRGVYYEHAAYIVDRVLNLNMVPLTVLREINGKIFSLQLFYPSRPWTRDLPEDHEIHTLRANDMKVFDKMIANVDRDVSTGHNAVVGVDGRLIGIDHTRSFQESLSSSMWGLQILSTEMREKVLSIPMSAYRAALSATLTPKEIGIFEQKTNLLIQHVQKMKHSPQNVTVINKDFEISRDFIQPLDLSKYKFIDFVTVQAALGANPKPELAKNIADIVREASDKYFLYRLVIENWETYPQEVRKGAIAAIAAHEGSHDQSFLEKVVRGDPHLILELMKNERIMRNYSYIIYYGLMFADTKKISPELYNAAIDFLVERMKKNMTGINFEDLFRGPNEGVRNAFLRDFYKALVREGMELYLADIFRLNYEKNQNLPKLLLDVTPTDEKEVVRGQLISSAERILRMSEMRPDKGGGPILASQINFLRESAPAIQVCPAIFGF